MSWRAFRFHKKAARLCALRRGSHKYRSGRTSKEGIYRQVPVVPEESLVKVFGSLSVHHALRVCVRIQRMKARAGEGKNLRGAGFSRKRVEDRNYHHLTPRCRRGQPHHGDGWYNLLLIRVNRHVAWHKVFGVRTLEEVIAALLICVKLNYEMWISLEYACRFPREEQPMRRRVRDFRSQLISAVSG